MVDQTAPAADPIQTLEIYLNNVQVGTLVRTPGDFNAFSLAPDYRNLPNPPILSLSLRSANGGFRPDPKPYASKLPPFFANLLPEDKLREAMEKHHAAQVRPGNDFDLLAALGGDLPGAVRAVPPAGTPAAASAIAQPEKLRFSLAGVQMKLSVWKNSGKQGGLTLAVGNESGQYIAKFPSMNLPALSENEFAMLALAEKLGMDVPERELIEKKDFEGIPAEFTTISDDKVLLIRRFDRGEDNKRIHIEDFAQVFDKYPGQKYEGAAYHNIADVLNQAVSFEAAIEFVKRLAFSAVIGNGDMHLKNWSLIYPGDGSAPALAPIYDVLSTIAYIPGDSLALSLGGVKPFKALTPDRWRHFANRAKLPDAAVLKARAEIAALVDRLWWKLPERNVLPSTILKKIDEHIKMIVPILKAD